MSASPAPRDGHAPHVPSRWKGPLTAAVLLAEIGALILVFAGVTHSKVVLAALEAGIAAVGITTVVVLLRRWSRFRRDGLSARLAIIRALNDVMAPKMARLLIGEVRIFSAIGRWITRSRGFGPAAEQIVYGKNLRPILLALVPVSLMEMGVIALLLHEYWIHWLILGVSAYATLWLIGLAAATRVRPHTLEGDRLTLRCMTFDELEVGLGELDDLKVVDVAGCKRSVEIEDGVMTMSIMGKANVAMAFREPVLVGGDREFAVREIRFAADAPRSAIELLRPLSAAHG